MSAKKYTGYYTYRVWLAYLNHFTKENFSVLKYPAARCNLTTYERSRLRYAFERLSDQFPADQIRSVILANFVQAMYENADEKMFWMTQPGEVKRNWSRWSHRMRHFQDEVLNYSGFSYTMGESGTVFERFNRLRDQDMSPEAFLISVRGTTELKELQDRFGEVDSFPNYYEEILFLRKYDLLLEKIPPVREFLERKGI